MNELPIIYNQEVLGKDFHIYGTVEEPLFLAKDIAEWIGHTDLSRMVNLVDEDEKLKRTLYVSGQGRAMWFLTEDGLYEVLMQSRKPIAKQFKKKVKEILKGLRKGELIINKIGRKQQLQLQILNGDEMERVSALKEYGQLVTRPLLTKIEEDKPKVEKFEDFMDTDGTMGFRELVKHLNSKLGRRITENQVRQLLIYKNILVKQGKKYVISQEGIRNGYGVIKDYISPDGKNRPQNRFTDKTRDELAKILK